jgi:hypothetical protein
MNVAIKQYLKEMGAGLAIYAVLLVGSLSILKRFELGVFKYLLVLAPMAGAALAVVAVIRYFAQIDELERKIQLDALAIAFGASALALMSYGFLEGAGLPHLNWTWGWPVMGAMWALGSVISRRRYR